MVNKKLIDVFLANATKEALIKGINALIIHLKLDSEYEYETRVNTLIDIIGGDKLPTIEDIDINFIKENIETCIYKGEEINKDSIEIKNIDYIDKAIKITYTRNGSTYNNSDKLPYIDYLKKVKEN